MAIASVHDVDFAAEASVSDGVLRASVSGNADLNVRLALERFLAAVHEEARNQKLRNVSLDVRQLAFMNSSCLKSLVVWVTQIQDLPADQRYQVTLVSSPTLYWQKRSLVAISSLASDIVTIEPT
jgi:hypothetical protein